MTPETARDIYHIARIAAVVDAGNHSLPAIQDECDLAGWAAVIEAIQAEFVAAAQPRLDDERDSMLRC